MILVISLKGFSQSKLYHIDKPTIVTKYKEVKDVLICIEKDSTIGKFTTEFASNIAEIFKLKGGEVHTVIKTPNDKPNVTANQVDSILKNHDPNGIIILRLVAVGIMKASVFGELRRSFVFKFEYSYRENDIDNFVQMYMTQISVDMEKIDFAEPSTSEALITKMRKKKIILE